MEKIELTTKITEIQKEITKLKHDVKEFMDYNYVEFVPRLKKDQALVREAEKIIEEMKNLQKRVDDQVQYQILFINSIYSFFLFDLFIIVFIYKKKIICL